MAGREERRSLIVLAAATVVVEVAPIAALLVLLLLVPVVGDLLRVVVPRRRALSLCLRLGAVVLLLLLLRHDAIVVLALHHLLVVQHHLILVLAVVLATVLAVVVLLPSSTPLLLHARLVARRHRRPVALMLWLVAAWVRLLAVAVVPTEGSSSPLPGFRRGLVGAVALVGRRGHELLLEVSAARGGGDLLVANELVDLRRQDVLGGGGMSDTDNSIHEDKTTHSRSRPAPTGGHRLRSKSSAAAIAVHRSHSSPQLRREAAPSRAVASRAGPIRRLSAAVPRTARRSPADVAAAASLAVDLGAVASRPTEPGCGTPSVDTRCPLPRCFPGCLWIPAWKSNRQKLARSSARLRKAMNGRT